MQETRSTRIYLLSRLCSSRTSKQIVSTISSKLSTAPNAWLRPDKPSCSSPPSLMCWSMELDELWTTLLLAKEVKFMLKMCVFSDTHKKSQTVEVCQTNRYWQPSVSSRNSGIPSPAVGLQWNRMVEYTVLVWSRPHLDSDGTRTSRFPPDTKKITGHIYIIDKIMGLIPMKSPCFIHLYWVHKYNINKKLQTLPIFSEST